MNKIAILNYSGNVGKTTIARDVFKHRLPDYELISIESVNSDGKETLVIRGDHGDKIYTEILLNDALILDIGSSNLESFFRSGAKEAEILGNIDIFVVPVTPEAKQQHDTVKTVRDLLGMGIPPQKIHVICNQVKEDPLNPVSSVFGKIQSAITQMGVHMDYANAISAHDLYSGGQTLGEMLSDRDYRSEMETAKAQNDNEKARKLAVLYVKQKNLRRLDEHYQHIFDNVLVVS